MAAEHSSGSRLTGELWLFRKCMTKALDITGVCMRGSVRGVYPCSVGSLGRGQTARTIAPIFKGKFWGTRKKE